MQTFTHIMVWPIQIERRLGYLCFVLNYLGVGTGCNMPPERFGFFGTPYDSISNNMDPFQTNFDEFCPQKICPRFAKSRCCF